jgi:hypothetical protein
MVRTYQEVFDELYMLDVPGTTNKILFAMPRKLALDRPALVQLARQTGSAKQFQFDLADIDEQQFHNLGRKARTGRVLRDADPAQQAGAR